MHKLTEWLDNLSDKYCNERTDKAKKEIAKIDQPTGKKAHLIVSFNILDSA